MPSESPLDDSPTAGMNTGIMVQHMRQVLLWPLRLMPASDVDDSELRRAPWKHLQALGEATPWREHNEDASRGASSYEERYYNEFVSFLPYVQRFLYGQGRSRRGGDEQRHSGSPMRIFRRHDIAAVRVVPREGMAPVLLKVVHVDLYFFYAVDVVMLKLEVQADHLPLALAQDILYRFGRAYPGGWDAEGHALHCMHQTEWLDANGQVLAQSDARQREAFLAHVAEHRAPRISRHWEFVLAPLVNHHSEAEGALRFRQIEYYRMPMMAYVAVNQPAALRLGDFVRLGLVSGAGLSRGDPVLPLADPELSEFEKRYCYDRFWTDGGAAPKTRYLCSGLALIVVGDASSAFYACGKRGVLAQFRHQHFLLFLIAHFQKAALLMMSDQLAETLTALDVSDANSVKRFKRRIRLGFVAFLGFTHRYWFHEVSEQAQVKALFHMCTEHLKIDPLYAEVKERIQDMNGYLDADALRRQANTVVRLTVVTIFGLIGTVTTGFLGMNLLSEAEAPLWQRVLLFALTMVAAIGLTLYTIVKSKRLSDFLDLVSDERVSAWVKLKAFFGVWFAPKA